MRFENFSDFLIFIIIAIAWIVGIFTTAKKLPKQPQPQQKKKRPAFKDYLETLKYEAPKKEVPEETAEVEETIPVEPVTTELKRDYPAPQVTAIEIIQPVFRLNLNQDTLQKGIVLSIILGPPKAKRYLYSKRYI
ncbi:MAG: hypothetical protein V1893_02015 [Candidatus Omnitrophota bacterium]